MNTQNEFGPKLYNQKEDSKAQTPRGYKTTQKRSQHHNNRRFLTIDWGAPGNGPTPGRKSNQKGTVKKRKRDTNNK